MKSTPSKPNNQCQTYISKTTLMVGNNIVLYTLTQFNSRRSLSSISHQLFVLHCLNKKAGGHGYITTNLTLWLNVLLHFANLFMVQYYDDDIQLPCTASKYFTTAQNGVVFSFLAVSDSSTELQCGSSTSAHNVNISPV